MKFKFLLLLSFVSLTNISLAQNIDQEMISIEATATGLAPSEASISTSQVVNSSQLQRAATAPILNWTKANTAFKAKSSDGFYNSFFVDGDSIKIYNNNGNKKKGSIYLGTGNIKTGVATWQKVIDGGPTPELKYLRAPAVARGSDGTYWAIIEATKCYFCNDVRIFRKVVYSSPDGINWTYRGISMLGSSFMPTWEGAMSLIYQPEKPNTIDLINPENNRFIYILRNVVAVSHDGINFKQIPEKIPAPTVLIFTSLAKTPHGYHLMGGDKWTNSGVPKVLHYFSKDLKTWKLLEAKTTVRPPGGYKGVNLYYDAVADRLWSYSARKGGTNYLFWLKPQEF